MRSLGWNDLNWNHEVVLNVMRKYKKRSLDEFRNKKAFERGVYIGVLNNLSQTKWRKPHEHNDLKR